MIDIETSNTLKNIYNTCINNTNRLVSGRLDKIVQKHWTISDSMYVNTTNDSLVVLIISNGNKLYYEIEIEKTAGVSHTIHNNNYIIINERNSSKNTNYISQALLDLIINNFSGTIVLSYADTIILHINNMVVKIVSKYNNEIRLKVSFRKRFCLDNIHEIDKLGIIAPKKTLTEYLCLLMLYSVKESSWCKSVHDPNLIDSIINTINEVKNTKMRTKIENVKDIIMKSETDPCIIERLKNTIYLIADKLDKPLGE